MVDWTGQALEEDRIQALARQRARVAEVRAQLDRLRRLDLPALEPVNWRSEAQRRYSAQLVELRGMLERASTSLDGGLEALDRALAPVWSGP